jgi:UDP:flavonoid glycosyltransferase YjiC (YdhE family)
MVRCLFVTWFGGGNVRPVLATAKAVNRLGGRALVLSNAPLAPRAEAVDLAFRAFSGIVSHDPSTPATDQVRVYEGNSVAERNRIIADRLVFGPAEAVARDVDSAIASFDPHVMLVDYTLPGAMASAERHSVPYIVASDTVYPLPSAPRGERPSLYASLFARMVRNELHGDSRINRLRSALGLPLWFRLEDYLAGAAETVIMSYPELNPYPLPPRASFVGPQFEPPDRLEHDSERDVFLCSFSTIATPEQDAFLDSLLEAPIGGRFQAVIASGAARARARPGLTIAAYVDFDRILPRCALMLNHAGNGTVVRAVAHGVPQISVPFIQDQFESAKVLEQLGVSALLSKTAGPAEIALAIATGLEDRDRQFRARQLAQSIARNHVRDALAHKLLALAS